MMHRCTERAWLALSTERAWLALSFIVAGCLCQTATKYNIASSPLGPVFHGIGGVSAGASSQTLFEYPQAQQDAIMDLLFRPSYGASLHSLKAEIGGDGQSTEGSEPSHMHTADDLNCARGYEFKLMAAARTRNPDIWIGGLSWCWPSWIGRDQNTNPYKYVDDAAAYAVSWVKCAAGYNLSMSFMSGWNERTESAEYMKALRSRLDSAGFTNTVLVCGDGVHAFNCAKLVAADPTLRAIVYALGAHGPSAYDPVAAGTGLPMWNNEAHFSQKDGSDWATTINTAYLSKNITGLQAWALISGYDSSLPFSDEGLMRAWWPQSGHYEAIGRLWVTAHTTQFTQPRSWHFLANKTGSGYLRNGGTYVSYMSPATADWTIVIEKMPGDGRGVTAENATFVLDWATASPVAVWLSDLSIAHADNGTSHYFIEQAPITIGADGSFSLMLMPATLWTVSTVRTGHKGAPPPAPPPASFPASWSDDFNACTPGSDALYFIDQNGGWECVQGDGAHGIVMEQMVPAKPITWRPDETRPHSVIGSAQWRNTDASIDFLLPKATDVALFAVHCSIAFDKAGPNLITISNVMPGLWLSLSTSSWALFPFVANVTTPSAALARGSLPSPLQVGTWHMVRMSITGTRVTGSLDGTPVFSALDVGAAVPVEGWVGIGTADWGQHVQFDNISITTSG